ncbi:hypothetical protein LSTR_LSTR016545 [Laodelphax striatellus]|nr:hypothetical protein LSTR_LSTR016545 [Laodelphax striatellus]
MTEDSFPVNNISNSEIVNLTAAEINGKRLEIDRLYFTGSLDGISAEDFGNWLLTEGNQTVKTVCQIKNLEAKNGVKLTSNLINGVDIDEFVANVINISEPITLRSVVFEDEINVENGVDVGGLVNAVEFSDKELVLKVCRNETVIFSGDKVLDGDLEAESLDVDDLKTFCKVFVDPQDDDPHLQLEIVGNVKFSTEPTLKFLNNHNISELLDSLWFVDEDFIIDHDMVFESVIFNGDVNMSPGSELNGMNLSRLSEEYFSLTADQKITKEMIFDRMSADGLTVAGRVEAYDLVAGMRFDEFVNSVMRQKRRQRV